MLKIDSSSKIYPLYTMIMGMIAYSISGVAAGILMYTEKYILVLVIGGALAGLIMGILLQMNKKLNQIVISSAIGIVASSVVSFALGYIIPSSFPFLGDFITTIVSSILMLVIWGAIMAPSLNGYKAIPFYMLVCGITAIISSILISTIFSSGGANFIMIFSFLGIAIGLSNGLYTKKFSSRVI